MEMAWPLVRWIMSASSSSSSAYAYDDVDDSDYNEAESPNDDVSCDDSVSPSRQILPHSTAAAAAKRRRPDGDDVDEEVVIKRVSQKRAWNKEDGLELLHGFLDHVTKSRRISTNGRLQKDYVSSFYDEVKPELQLRFVECNISGATIDADMLLTRMLT